MSPDTVFKIFMVAIKYAENFLDSVVGRCLHSVPVLTPDCSCKFLFGLHGTEKPLALVLPASVFLRDRYSFIYTA